MKNNVLITGSAGQLGTELSALLPDAFRTDSTTLDITNANLVQDFVKRNQIDVIINCAAYTVVDKAEDEPDLAERVNVQGPLNLAKTGARIIHISTDYVFDGKGCRPYVPEDETHPLSVYGQTKRAGELAVLENAQMAIIIRTAWLYSAYGKNFVKTMRMLGQTKDSINVVYDQIGTPTYAGDLAQAIVDILPKIQAGQKEIYHYTNEGVCSWYDFAIEIMALSGLNCRVNPILSSEYPTKAVRPFYSVLNKDKIKRDFQISIPHWKESLVKCLSRF